MYSLTYYITIFLQSYDERISRRGRLFYYNYDNSNKKETLTTNDITWISFFISRFSPTRMNDQLYPYHMGYTSP